MDETNSANKQHDHPFKGLSSAFKKLKNIEELTESEKEALKNFIDEFTTVSTNEATVGEIVSRMVLEVNMHSHTKSCRKYDCPCRFLYPRFPSKRTIIAEPIRGITDEEKKQRLQKYEETLDKVRTVLNDTDTVNERVLAGALRVLRRKKEEGQPRYLQRTRHGRVVGTMCVSGLVGGRRVGQRVASRGLVLSSIEARKLPLDDFASCSSTNTNTCYSNERAQADS